MSFAGKSTRNHAFAGKKLAAATTAKTANNPQLRTRGRQPGISMHIAYIESSDVSTRCRWRNWMCATGGSRQTNKMVGVFVVANNWYCLHRHNSNTINHIPRQIDFMGHGSAKKEWWVARATHHWRCVIGDLLSGRFKPGGPNRIYRRSKSWSRSTDK